MTLDELIKKSHSLAREKGFWDEERSGSSCLMLIITELGEAVEAHRKNRRSDKSTIIEWESLNTREFEIHVKDTVEDELADSVIRICDFIGSKVTSINLDYAATRYYVKTIDLTGDHVMFDKFEENIFEVIKRIMLPESAFALLMALQYLFNIANKENIDLWSHIEAKLKYNESRPRLHGKKY